MKHSNTAVEDDAPVDRWFGQSRSSYFVVPRVALQALPLHWQNQFVALMEEPVSAGLVTPHYRVMATGSVDPWKDFRTPDPAIRAFLAEVRGRMEATRHGAVH